MSTRPNPIRGLASAVIRLKRGVRGSPESNTVASRSSGFRCFTGEAVATEWLTESEPESTAGQSGSTSQQARSGGSEQTEESAQEQLYPPLVETVHAPLLDVLFANIFLKEDTVPPAAHLLYVSAPPRAGRELKLKLRIPFRDEAPVGHTSETQIARQTYKVAFDRERLNPDDEMYLVFLFMHGGSGRADQVKFDGIEVIDVTDDSPHGFPDYVELWVDGYDLDRKTLVFVESSPEMHVIDDLEDELDEEDYAQDPASINQEPDDWPWQAGAGQKWLS